MERCPHVLAEHKLQIFCAELDKSLAAGPPANEMDEGVGSAEFTGNSLRHGANRISVPQVNHRSEETFIRQV
jgi:hypothetical protein